MNGRCDNDPLDVADDICDICGGEFCTACVIWPRGQSKPPVCKTCALKNSGLRGTTKTERKASRRDAKKRREELIETRHERTDGKFRFFDESDDFQLPTDLFTGSVQAPEEAPNRRRISLGRKKHQDSEGGEARSDQTEMDTSWEQDVQGRAPGQGSGLPTSPVTDLDADPFAPIAAGEDGGASGSGEHSEFPDPALEDAEIVASMADPSTATALLERIRSDNQLPPLPAYPASANESGFAFPQSTHGEEPAFAAGALDFDHGAFDQRVFAPETFSPDNVNTQVDPFSSGALQGDPFATHQGAFEHDPFAIAEAPATPHPHPVLPHSPTLLPQSPTLSEPVLVDPVVEPVIGVDDPFGAADSPPPPPPSPPLVPPPPPPPVVTNPTHRPVAAHAVNPGTAKPFSADVDGNGNWIPPLLRGMAPKAERELETLPRRTSRVIDDDSIPAALRGVGS